MTVTGHGMPSSLTESLSSMAISFFDQPPDAKQRHSSPDGMGYLGFGDEKLGPRTDKFLELRETLNLGWPPDRFPGHSWPTNPVGLHPLAADYAAKCLRIAESLMGLFAMCLDLPISYFENSISSAPSILRLAHYPHAGPLDQRAAAHTDYGTVTLAHVSAPGLQLLTHSNEWLDVPVLEGGFIVHIGELMRRWSNGRWVCASHRVANSDLSHSVSRYSIVFFHNPGLDVVVDAVPTCVDAEHPPLYSPVRAGDYLRSRVDAALGLGGTT
jgi:isopenicillin N synthase-like dioxygenase